ncbi:hypothetical protein L210DRAFT_3502003 [Boletus edulis BED1]|uniref:Uncharacterized protein n=1 Tax=Boletus edulis BED1 TaxID=1328754 RepID=A0AAD4C2K8_BOLED|nr:hypothetical protein L210DRAFT_3502003 [Boletus edulis BED1]
MSPEEESTKMRRSTCAIRPTSVMREHVRAGTSLALSNRRPSVSGTPANRSIINVSSTSGLHGNVGQVNYAAAKSAVVGLTKTIAKEWGVSGVRANTVAYGLVHTKYLVLALLLTASKEDGAMIEIEGKKVALGIPAAQARVAESVNAYAYIPLHRGTTPDEAAAAMLFLASPLASYGWLSMRVSYLLRPTGHNPESCNHSC